MSDVMKVLPCRGVEVDVWSQDGDIVLKTPCGPVAIEPCIKGGVSVCKANRLMGEMPGEGAAVWMIVVLYGEGEVDWNELHGRLFGGE